MNYTTVEMARKWLGDKIALYGGNNADDADIANDLSIAEGMVDTYLSAQYKTPMTNANAVRLLVGHVRWFFLEQAYQRSAGGEAPEGVQKAIDRVIKQLEAVSQGKQRFAGLESDKVEPKAASSMMFVDAEPTRDAEALKGF